MRIVPFEVAHLQSIVVQPAQQYGQMWGADYRALEGPWAWTGMVGDEVLICAGMVEVWPNRAQAWALLSKNAGQYMKSITKATLRAIKLAPWRRIEMNVDCDFEQGHRWANMLGFAKECDRMRAYYPDGRDMALYARVKNG